MVINESALRHQKVATTDYFPANCHLLIRLHQYLNPTYVNADENAKLMKEVKELRTQLDDVTLHFNQYKAQVIYSIAIFLMFFYEEV